MRLPKLLLVSGLYVLGLALVAAQFLLFVSRPFFSPMHALPVCPRIEWYRWRNTRALVRIQFGVALWGTPGAVQGFGWVVSGACCQLIPSARDALTRVLHVQRFCSRCECLYPSDYRVPAKQDGSSVCTKRLQKTDMIFSGSDQQRSLKRAEACCTCLEMCPVCVCLYDCAVIGLLSECSKSHTTCTCVTSMPGDSPAGLSKAAARPRRKPLASRHAKPGVQQCCQFGSCSKMHS